MVRAARPADLDAVVELHTAARTAYYQAGGLPDGQIDPPQGPERRRRDWARVIRSGSSVVVCAVRGEEVLGVAAMGPPKEPASTPHGELYQIHVRPGYWGQGIGSQLHATFVRFLGASGMRGRVEAWDRNVRAQAFYARHGWRADGHRRPGPDGSWYVRMRLEVDGGRGSQGLTSASSTVR